MRKEARNKTWTLGFVALLAIGFASSSLHAGNDKKEPHGYLGVYVEGVSGTVSRQLGLEPDVGVVVEGLVPGGPAEAAGLEKHDILLKFDDQILIGTKQIVVLVRNSDPGTVHEITYLRGGKESIVEVELGESKPKKRLSGQQGNRFSPPPPPAGGIMSSNEMNAMMEKAEKVRIRALESAEEARVLSEIKQLERLKHLDSDVLFHSGDDEIDLDRRMEFNEKVEVLMSRVNSAVEGVEGIAMPTVVLKDQNHIFEFRDDSGVNFVIIGEGDQKELVVVDADGSEIYSGPLNDEAKEKLPEDIRERLPRIQRIITLVPEPPVAPTVGRTRVDSF